LQPNGQYRAYRREERRMCPMGVLKTVEGRNGNVIPEVMNFSQLDGQWFARWLYYNE
jgi:hypothetical protein